MSQEATLVIVKPDGLKKSLTGNILSRLSETKLRIIAAKIVVVTKEFAQTHYGHLKDEKFFDDLIKYITGELHDDNRVMALIYWGEDAIEKVRAIAGATNPEEAEPVTIRGAYGRILTSGLFENVIHASSEPSEAQREIKLWFSPEEVAYDLYPTKTETVNNAERKVWE